MAITVNTNIASLNAQRNMANNTVSLNTALQRLSSGLRINSAADDSAGLSISVGLQSQVRGMNQAVRNANDGLSLLGTAESALNEQSNLLQRMRELSVQASSDTNSGTNRSTINDEITQLKSEFDRISRTTQFNGINLLDGSFSGKEIQVGANQGATQKISVSIDGTRAASIGQSYSKTGTAVDAGGAAAGAVKITVDGIQYDVGQTQSDGISPATGAAGSAIAYANAVNDISGDTGVFAEAQATSYTGAAIQADAGGSLAAGDVKINGVDIGAVTIVAGSGSGSADNSIVQAINKVSSQTGVTASLNASNKIVLAADDGRNIEITTTANGNTVSGLHAAGTYTATAAVKLTSYKSTFSVTDASSKLNLSGGAALGTESISALSVTTKTGAESAISTIDGALSQLNDRLSAIGAQTNRLNSAIRSLSAASENMSASNSRIQDADFAAETASMSRAQILAQAGVAVLAQANQGPQLALSLLR